MAGINELAKGIQTVDEMLAEAILEPDLDRNDWSKARSRVAFVGDVLERDVLASLDEALFSADEDLAPRVKRRVASLVGEVAGVFAASGDMDGAKALLGKAAAIAEADEQKRELDGAKEDPMTFAKLTHARWLQGKSEFKRADTILAKARRGTTNKALRAAIQTAERAPRPIERAPTLFRVNGIGVGLYGERDKLPDGSYVATHCFCIFWIPILPLSAYRVRQADSNSYQFYAKESLGPIARAWRALVLVGALTAGGYAAVTNYLDSPPRKAAAVMTEAKNAEKAGDREQALERYRFALNTYPQEIDTDEAASSIVRIGADNDVKEPVNPGSLEAIGRVVNAFNELPSGVRTGKVASLLADKLVGYADQIGQDTSEKAEASLTVLDMAARVTGSRNEAEAIVARRAKLRKDIADGMAATRPLGALRHYIALGDPPSVATAGKIIESFGAAPSLWMEAEYEITKWTSLADKQGLTAEAQATKKRLQDAQKKLTDDQPLFEAADEKALRKALADVPGYQEVAMGVASILRGRGDTKAALDTLVALGAPGRLTTTAQQALADMHAEAGDFVMADAILTALVNERLPAFQEAQRTYRATATRFEEEIFADLRAGNVPRDLEKKLNTASEAEQKVLINRYLEERFRDDPGMAALREEFVQHAVVIPPSISLGMVKLRRASTATGETQRVLLEQAERAFLALQGEAAGNPGYHLGLGQVYHRLGRAADGDAEFEGILAKKSPDLSLSVATAYRELGLEPRARQVVEAVYNDKSVAQDKRYQAANLRTYMATGLEDKEKWLELSDQSLPLVKAQLINVKGERALFLGKWSDAERAFAEETAYYEKGATHDAVAANNLATIYSQRYQASGDMAHLRSCVKWLDSAVRLKGDNAIVLNNLADALSQMAQVVALDKKIDLRALRLGQGDIKVLSGAALDGSLRAEVMAALEKDPNQQRMLEISRRVQVLAPQRTEAYRRELEWYEERDDSKALGELRARLEAMKPFNEQNTTDARAAWVQGERDAELGWMLKQQADLWRNTIPTLEKTARPPTVAAAWLVFASLLYRRMWLDASTESIDEMVRAYRRARELWPEGISERPLSGALFTAAIGKARFSSPALAKAWEADRRTISYSRLAYRAAQGPNGEEVLAALRKQPELAEAVALRRGKLDGKPSVSDWIMGRLAGDIEFENEAAKVFDRDVVRHEAEIEARILPGQPEEQMELALVRSRGKSDH